MIKTDRNRIQEFEANTEITLDGAGSGRRWGRIFFWGGGGVGKNMGVGGVDSSVTPIRGGRGKG